MTKIFKYALDHGPGGYLLPMPDGAQPLCVQIQHNSPCIWALVNPDNEARAHRFIVVGTGHPLPDISRMTPAGKELKYLGTCQMYGGELVWHVFQVL